MSLLKGIANFARRLLVIEQRVEDNTRTIRELRRELKATADFSRSVAAIVERNQAVADDKQKLLIAQLQNELLKLSDQNTVSRWSASPKQ